MLLPRFAPAQQLPAEATPRCVVTTAAAAQVEEDPTGGKFSAAGGTLNSAPHKLEDAVHFHVGDIVKALGRAALSLGRTVDPVWIGTDEVAADPGGSLASMHAIWCVPASPYRSMEGALAAIRRAARPVGATSRTDAFWAAAAAHTSLIVAVLPVPGPPVTTERREANAARTAAACRKARITRAACSTAPSPLPRTSPTMNLVYPSVTLQS